MAQVIHNTTGKDDADYQSHVRAAVVKGLAPKPKAPQRGSYYDRVVKRQEDSEEG